MPFKPNRILTLSSDFGTADGYVGAMKGRALSVDPELKLVDLGHTIPPWDIRRAAFALWTAIPSFPPGTVHVVVVDPGVGTGRKALVALAGGQAIVAPDNGTISLLFHRYPHVDVFRLEPPVNLPQPIAPTFHGRDLFAPAGALMASGRLELPGSLTPEPRPIRFPCGFSKEKGTLTGSVLCADNFGNLITSIPWSEIPTPEEASVSVPNATTNRCVRTYGDAPADTLCFLKGSSGLLEVSCVRGCAQTRCGAKPGDTVIVSCNG